MNKNIIVCAGWLDGNPKIGELFIENPRGEEIISFQFAKEWLVKHSVCLDPNLSMTTLRQYPPKQFMFGFLDDICPDRWGRRLIDRAIHSKGVKRTVLPSDYLLGVSDAGRVGGIRLQTEDGVFLGSTSLGSIPPITDLRKLEKAINVFEQNKENVDPYLKDILVPGSSLGGARPKANVIDTDGSLWIAKFPSKNDDYDVGAWEMVVHKLAKMCGISVPEAKSIKLSDRGTIFLVKRFDRSQNGLRVHYASAMNMLGEHDNSEVRSSYLDIVSRLSEISNDFASDAKQLFERMLFNVSIGNTDDHLRNHGFLLSNDAWRLSEAFDLNPSVDKQEMSLCLDLDSNEKSIDLALSVCEYFEYSQQEACETAKRFAKVISQNVASLAKAQGLSNTNIDYMLPAFSESFRYGCGVGL